MHLRSLLADSRGEEGPDVQAVDQVSRAALVGICVGSAFFLVTAVTCFCYRRKWASGPSPNKLTQAIKRGASGEGPPLVHRKPTALKSPSSGSVCVLKKSPSPPAVSPVADRCCVLTSGGSRQNSPVTEEKPPLDTVKKEETDDSKEKEVLVEKPAKLGQLHFRLQYVCEKQSLLVGIVRCSELPEGDPYVKLQLLPEKRHKVKTRVLRKTTQPRYDEDFTFYGVDGRSLAASTLHFVVLSFDRYSRDDVIGEVICPLAPLHLAKQIELSQEIAPRNLKIRYQGRGELLVSLCYQPAANRLTVVVLKARNLPKMDFAGLCDPYVKIYLLYNKQRIAKKKTHVKKRTTGPVFNESFVFEVPYNEGLARISLEFLVLDWDRLTKNEVIGRLELGPDAPHPANNHWAEVCAAPRRQIAEWHKLKE